MSLSANTKKIGFPNQYRKDSEGAIFEDVLSKLNKLLDTQQTVLDIGSGCSDLPRMLMDL